MGSARRPQPRNDRRADAEEPSAAEPSASDEASNATSSPSPEAGGSSLETACLCAQVAEEHRGRDTVVLDLRKITPVFDYFVITTGTSRRQMLSMAEEADRVMKERHTRCLGVEGREGSQWLLHDYGDVVLHIFAPETRAYYDLEHLWADAPRVDWRTVLKQRSTPSKPQS